MCPTDCDASGSAVLAIRRYLILALLVSSCNLGVVSLAQEQKLNGRVAASAEFETLAPGLEYRHDVRAKGPLSIHVLRIDRKRRPWEFHTGLATGTVIGLEPLDGIVRRVEITAKKQAAAAINGDFFVIKEDPYQGDPRGIQIAGGELVSRPAGNAFWISAQGAPTIGAVASKMCVVWPDKTTTALGLNEARADDGVVLYTPALGVPPTGSHASPPSTRTKGGRELVLERVADHPWLPLQVGKSYVARVWEIRETGNTPLSNARMVLSVGPRQVSAMPAVQSGDTVRLVTETEPDLQGVTMALGGGRVLLHGGTFPDLGPADQPRHPRSMLGWNDTYLFLIVVDGRQAGVSIGMAYPEMAELVKQYGCTDAMELDGGGSSTLWARGKILNVPSDGHARAIANALVVLGSGEPDCPKPDFPILAPDAKRGD